MTTTTIKLAHRIVQAGSLLALLSAAAPQSAGADDLRVYFKLDPHLTQSLQMGERFVSPDVFYTTVQRGGALTVEMEARDPDVAGDRKDVPAMFAAADPASAAVKRGQGNRSKVTLQGCGKTQGLQASGHSKSRQLTATTICEGNTIRAVISQ